MSKDIPIAFIDDDDTIYESEDFVNFKLEDKDKEIEILENKLKMIKINIDKLTKEQIIEVIDNYTGMFGIKDSDKK